MVITYMLCGALIGALAAFAQERARRIANFTATNAAVRERELAQIRFDLDCRSLTVRLDQERLEVRRLTNVIIKMRRARQELPPEATDQVWGRHVVDEASYTPPAETAEAEAEANALREMDMDVIAEIEGSLRN